MSENQNQIEKGKIYIVTDEPLFIYHRSDFYVTNGKVIPDGVNWHKAKTYGDTYVAIHESELHVSILAKDESGADVLCIKDRCDFLTARKADGSNAYFINEAAAEANNFKFSFRLSRWHDANCSTFFGDEKLLGYHTSQNVIDRDRLPKLHTDNDEYLCGLEVEKN